MRKALAMSLLCFAAQACTQPAAPGNASASGAPRTPDSGSAGERRDVYVAFSTPRDRASMLATFGGRLEVLDGCLVLRSENGLHVPVFAPSADTYVTDSSAVIAGRAVALGSEIIVAGGEMGANDDAVLQRPRPAQCRHRLLRAGSWAPSAG
ncbi:MAG TPA: hypothetical protein VE053_03115 [Allosphingosinicella sp.]|nr:hypothetical protein [Allosphingosinicella sp.]